MTDSMAKLENDITQFVTAMKHANNTLASLETASRSFITSRHSHQASQPLDKRNESATTSTASNNTTTTSDSSDQAIPANLSAVLNSLTGVPMESNNEKPISSPTADAEAASMAQRRESFTEMRGMWLNWGQELMKTLERWLDRPDLGIADRVRVIGCADRLAWYGVAASREKK